LHLARTVTRRAERAILRLAEREPVDEQVRKFINRSSDFFFAAARYANAICGAGDVAWDQRLAQPQLDPDSASS
jgi:cob(I)alamin adenosyltransferase